MFVVKEPKAGSPAKRYVAWAAVQLMRRKGWFTRAEVLDLIEAHFDPPPRRQTAAAAMERMMAMGDIWTASATWGAGAYRFTPRVGGLESANADPS